MVAGTGGTRHFRSLAIQIVRKQATFLNTWRDAMSTGLALSLLCAGDQVFGCCYTTSYSCCRQLSKHNTHNPLSLVTIHLISPTRDSVVEELNDKDGLVFRWAASLLQVHGHHLEELSCVQLRALLFNDAHPARRLVVPPAAWYADATRAVCHCGSCTSAHITQHDVARPPCFSVDLAWTWHTVQAFAFTRAACHAESCSSAHA